MKDSSLEFINKVLSGVGSVSVADLEALDGEIARLRELADDLEAIRRVAWLACMEKEAAPANAKEAGKTLSSVKKNGSLQPGNAGCSLPSHRLSMEAGRLVLAKSIAADGPGSVGALAARTGISRNGLLSVGYLIKNHEWFEKVNDEVHLTAVGHQHVTGKGDLA